MPAERISIHPVTPERRKVDKVAGALRNGAVIVYPTDTVYGIGCDLMNRKAVARLCQLQKIDPRKMNLSFICSDLSSVSDYAHRIETPVYKLIRSLLPGPYTFIFPSSSRVPRILDNNKKTVGIRIPANRIVHEIVTALGNPLISASIKDKESLREYLSDPDEIYEAFRNKADLVIDGGPGGVIPSTVIDCTGETPVLVRQGLGPTEAFLDQHS
jgi:tRNA threonylcarbamoyl adenosine modification protein (Sua5/YciO/YrdC/YwlC family)